MKTRWNGLSRWSILLLLQTVVRVSTTSLAISYCSTDNTGSSSSPMNSEYQSTGLCGDHCQGSFAFAVLLGNSCWCSNYIPTDQEKTITCSSSCPGTGDEWCGNTEAGLYGYYALAGGSPLGTAGSGSGSSDSAPSSTSSLVSTTRSSSSSPSPSPSRDTSSSSSVRPLSRPSSISLVTVVPPQSSVQTVAPSTVSSVRPSSTYEPPSSTYTPPSSTYYPPASTYTPPPSSSPSPSPSPLPSPSYSSSPSPSVFPSPYSSAEQSITSTPVPTEVYTSITTVTGRVQTVIITPSATASADATLGQGSTSGGHGVSTGKVVGIVMGVALGIGLIIGILVWLWFRRKRRQDMRGMSPEAPFVAERSGVNSSGGNSVPSRQVSQMSTAGLLGKAPRIMTSGLAGGSELRSADTNGSGYDRRSVATDQRLNPWALYTQEDRLSNVSLQDNQDYSRQLRIANPDA